MINYICPACGGRDLFVEVVSWLRLNVESGAVEIPKYCKDSFAIDSNGKPEPEGYAFCDECGHSDLMWTFQKRGGA